MTFHACWELADYWIGIVVGAALALAFVLKYDDKLQKFKTFLKAKMDNNFKLWYIK